MKTIAMIAAALLLAGCGKTAVVVRTVEVKVPAPYKEQPPLPLAQCGREPPEFRFYAPDDSSDDVVIRKEDQAAFQRWINNKQRCITAWQEWAK